jgi:hypothetical protein
MLPHAGIYQLVLQDFRHAEKKRKMLNKNADKHLNILKRLIYMVNRYPIKRNVTSLMPINHEATVYSNSQAYTVYYVQRTLPYSSSGRLPASHLILMTN